MPLDPYRRVLSVPAMRQALVLGILVRIPIFAGGVLLTLHVVQTLDRTYGAAGLVTAAATVCIAVSGPWRGKLLDTRGLRRVVLPSLVVTAICWSIAPFVDYLPLLVLAALAGLFVVPVFSIIRQAVMAAVPDSDRRTALSLDSVAVEVSFMVGPLLGVWAATIWPTAWVLFTVEMLGVLAGVGLWLVNPVMHVDRGGVRAAPPMRTAPSRFPAAPGSVRSSWPCAQPPPPARSSCPDVTSPSSRPCVTSTPCP